MAEKVRLKISPAVTAFVRPGVSSDEKLKGLETASVLVPEDRVLLSICLMQDSDNVVKGAAGAVFEALPPEPLLELIRCCPEIPPTILDLMARVHYANPGVAEELLKNEALSSQARVFLQQSAMVNADLPEGDPLEDLPLEAGEDEEPSDDAGETDEMDTEALEEKSEEFLSKYKLSQTMGIADKIKMALTGDKEWRSLLIKDANKLVSGSVIKNPRITEAEILTLVKTGVQNDEIMRLVCANREWVKNLKIRKALVENPRTPVPNALRYLSSLGEKDIAAYAKSKNISSVISTQARRLLLSKKR